MNTKFNDIRPTYATTNFENLKPGDCFIFCGFPMIKIASSTPKAVRLTNGNVYTFDLGTLVNLADTDFSYSYVPEKEV